MIRGKADILLTPDIVFSMQVKAQPEREDAASFVFRDDKEKMLGDELQKGIVSVVNKSYQDCIFNDTCDVQISGNGFLELEEFIRSVGSSLHMKLG
jgi:exopolysaccharide biosynthesis predicted pyruvyltransferase EpsI